MNDKLEKLNNFVIFKTDSGKVNIDVFFNDDNLWLTQKKMAELFDVKINTINYHKRNIQKRRIERKFSYSKISNNCR
jgi:hypothetical protein